MTEDIGQSKSHNATKSSTWDKSRPKRTHIKLKTEKLCIQQVVLRTPSIKSSLLYFGYNIEEYQSKSTEL